MVLSGDNNRRTFFRNAVSALTLLFCACFCSAQTSAGDEATADKPLTPEEIMNSINALGDDYQNSIKLLNNRFRIDADVSAVTLIFFRAFGAAPVVLVKPDGSKLYLENDSFDDSYTWFETDTFDMIKLVNPTPGPWQAVGNILPNSRVMVIADIKLDSSTLPSVLFTGETLKITAELSNAGTKIDFNEFRDVVTLSVDFSSTNNPNYGNFGLGTKRITRFEDNGRGFDERAGDGIFTGEFDLSLTPGEWQPIFSVRTPLFSREQQQPAVVLLPSPITVTHTEGDGDTGNHVVIIDADNALIDRETMLLDGNVRHPNGEVTRFSSTVVQDGPRQLEVLNVGYGNYRVNLTVFAQTVTGRDVVLNIDEYRFTTEMPIVEETIEEVTEPVVPEKTPEEIAAEELAIKQAQEKATLIRVLIINAVILVVGIIVVLLLMDRRKNPDNPFTKRLLSSLKKIKLKKASKAPELSET